MRLRRRFKGTGELHITASQAHNAFEKQLNVRALRGKRPAMESTELPSRPASSNVKGLCVGLMKQKIGHVPRDGLEPHCAFGLGMFRRRKAGYEAMRRGR